jgi:hypothetical protein
MRTTLLTSALLLILAGAIAQSPITINAVDMPIAGDTLRWSSALGATAGISLSQTGANQTWNFSNITPVTQGVDQYKLAVQVNASYALTISPTAYGYKVSDSLPGASQLGGAITVSDVYNFFNKKSNPSRYVIEGFAANVAGFPTPGNYQREDTFYRFPMTYQSTDSCTYYLNVSIAGLGSLKLGGRRQNMVDGWGTIVTPYKTTPTACIRVRSEIKEMDTVNVTLLGQTVTIPRNTVEYRWLANGEHYPLMIVTTNKAQTGTETVSSVRYRDTKRTGLLSVQSTPAVLRTLSVYPNPARETVFVELPSSWVNYSVEVFDMQGRSVYSVENKNSIPMTTLSSGNYIVRVISGTEMGMAQLMK